MQKIFPLHRDELHVTAIKKMLVNALTVFVFQDFKLICETKTLPAKAVIVSRVSVF